MAALRRSALMACGAVVALAVTACGTGGALDETDAELELTGPGYVRSGAEFWDGWRVPVGTVLLGTPIPEPGIDLDGMPQEQYRISAEFLVTGDPHEVMRDLYDQIEGRGHRPVVDEWNSDTSVCAGWPNDGEYYCHLYGRADDDLTKIEARLDIRTTTMTDQPRQRLWITIGEYSQQDTADSYSDWSDAARPQGAALLQPRTVERSGLRPGDELPFYGSDEAIGVVPDGARMLAPSYNPSATYGFAGIFVVTDDQALAEFEEMAAEAATGERYPDVETTAGNLAAHRMSWDGSGGGCMVGLDVVELSDFTVARLVVVCD